MRTTISRAATGTAASLLACLLTACGGGGDDETCKNLDPSRDPSLPGCTVSSTPATGAAAALAPLAVTLADAGGAPTTMVSPKTPGVAKAVVKDGAGKPVAGLAVTFTSTDTSAVLVPATGSALTDANGVASIGVAAGKQAGAFTLTARATRDGTTATGSASYAVGFPVLTMSALSISPSPLPAGGTASLSVTLLDGSTPFAPAQEVTFTSPCAAAGKATISSPVTTVNGVASTSYIDNGCGAPDVVSATTVLAGASTSASGTVNVQAAEPGQLTFVSALPQNISLKGTGGAGRQESSTVVFRLLDRSGNPVSGQRVDFALTTTAGGLDRTPASATTGADGKVSTVVYGGTVNTPVRVVASIPPKTGSSTTITTLSDQLVVSTGVPDQDSFSLSTEIFNVEGMNINGCPLPSTSTAVASTGPTGSTASPGSLVMVRMADHFNNPAPDGTAVSFTSEGGTIDASCLTGLINTTLTDGTVITQKGIPGTCTVRFCAASPRPTDGRVTILAYALGEESFVDTNGTNLYFESPADPFQDLGEPFRNDRAITNRNAQANWGVDAGWIPARQAISPNDGWSTNNEARVSGEVFIDSNGNGAWEGTGDGLYNGVLRKDSSATCLGAQGPTATCPVKHVRSALVQVLSTSTAAITPLGSQTIALSQCVNGTTFVNSPSTLQFAIRDTNPTIFALNRANVAPLQLPIDLSGNILPAGTKIEFATTNGTLLSQPSYIVPNTNEPSAAAWIYGVQLQSDATQSPPVVTQPAGSPAPASPPLYCTNNVSSGALTVKVTSPSGVITTRSFAVTD